MRIAETFTDLLGRLNGDEQKAAKATAFDLQLDPANPGFQFHRRDRARDKKFWSVRVSAGLRTIVHRGDGGLLVCDVGRHDDAYRWAELRRLERHPTTGAAQLVELRESVREVVRKVVVRRLVEARNEPAAPVPKLPVLRGVPRDELLACGVPEEWVGEVAVVTEESLLQIAGHLPAEAAEAILDLATGGRPVQAPAGADPFAYPDAKRRFRLMATSRSSSGRSSTRGRSGWPSSTPRSARSSRSDTAGRLRG